MNKRALLLFVGLFASLLLQAGFNTPKTRAEHGSTPLQLAWQDVNTIESQGISTADTKNIKFTRVSENDLGGYGFNNDDVYYYVGSGDLSKFEGCKKNEPLAFYISKDKVDNFSSGQSTKIDGEPGAVAGSSGCDYVEILRHTFASGDANVIVNEQTDTASFTNQDGGGEGGEEEEGSTAGSCEEKSGPLGWILCPVINATNAGLNWLDTQIARLLTVDANRYNNPGMQAAAGVIRNIAFSILVPITLVMVISTALGFEFVSAYTVKRALPRLFAAVIFIALSFPLLTFFIEFVETIASGIFGILLNPFRGNGLEGDISLNDLFGPSIFTSIILAPYFAIGVGIVLWLFGSVLLLGLLISFGLLMARQVFIVGLLLLAPLAILAWIFPGNDKLWKSWWSAFSKLLFIYPIIMVLLAIGRVFAVILYQSNGGSFEGFIVEPILALLAYMAPYLAIPFTFKLAGGLFATVSNIANKPMQDQDARRRRHDSRAAKRSRLGSEKVFSPRTRAGRLANSALSQVYSPHKNVAYKGRNLGIPIVSSYGQRLAAGVNAEAIEQTAKLSQEMSKLTMNDKSLRVMGGLDAEVNSHLGGRPPKSIAEVRKAAEFMRERGKAAAKLDPEKGQTDIIGAHILEANAGRLASLYTDPQYGYASTNSAATMELARQGFASSHDLAQMGNNLIAEGTNPEFAQGLVNQAQLMGQSSRPDVKAGYGVIFENGKFVSGTNKRRPGQKDTDYKNFEVGARGEALAKSIKQTDWLGAKSMAVQENYANIRKVATELKEGEPPTKIVQRPSREKFTGEFIRDDAGEVVVDNVEVPNYTNEALAMQEQIALGASQFSSSDTGAKVVWKELVEELKLHDQLANADAIQAQQMQERGAAGGAPGGSGGGDGDGGAAGAE